MRSRSLVSLLTIAIVTTTAAHAVIPAGFSRVVILASNSIQLKKLSEITGPVQITGDVVGNQLPTGQTLTAAQVTLEKAVTLTGDLYGDSLIIKKDATLNGIAYCNTLTNLGTGPASCQPITQPVFAALPPFKTGIPGASDFVVPAGGSAELPPGAYRDIVVGEGATLNFDGGFVNARSFTMGIGGSLTFDLLTEITVAKKLVMDKNAFVGPASGAPITARDIVFYVDGINGTGGLLNEEPVAAEIGMDSVFKGTLWARNGTLHVHKNCQVTGAFLAKDVQVEKDVTFTEDSFFFNRAPVGSPDDDDTLEDNAVVIDVLANDTDFDGDNLIVNAVTQGSNGGVTNNGSNVTYTPNPDYFGPDSFTYTVCDDSPDGSLCDGPITVTVEVLPVNDAPSFVKGPDLAIDEDSSNNLEALEGVHVLPGWATSISVGPANESGQTIVFLVSNDNNGLFEVQPAVSPDGTLSFELEIDAFGTANVSVQAKDSGGTANGGVDVSAVQSFVIQVAPVNDPPVAVDDAGSVDEGGTLNQTVSVKNNDFDIDNLNSELTVTASAPTSGALTFNADGTYIYVHDGSETTSDVFQYELCDPDDACDTAVVTITINSINDAPTANSQDAFTSGDVNLALTLTGSDPEGDALTFSLVSAPTAGTLSGLPAGPVTTGSVVVTYDPAGADDVEDSFQFKVNDGSLDSAAATVRLNPKKDTGAQDPPDLGVVVAKPKSVELFENSTQNILTLVGAAPCDPSGAADPAQPCDGVDTVAPLTGDVPLTFSIVSGPTPAAAGTLQSLTQGSEVPQRTATVDFVPATDFEGEVSFVFQVAGDLTGDSDTDDPGETDSATVSIVVGPNAPAPPVAQNLVVGTTPDKPVVVDLTGALASGGICGNDIVEGTEQCDDGNRVDGDGCSSACLTEDPGRVTQGAGNSAPSRGAVRNSGSANGAVGGAAQGAIAQSHGTPIPITIGAGWTSTTAVPPAFFWGGGVPTFACDGDSQCNGPFTFSGAACISVTDDFLPGDQFRIYDNGEAIGETTVVPVDSQPPQSEVGPDAAFASATFSSGQFDVGAGSHSIEIEVINESFPSGRGYIRVDSPTSSFCNQAAPTLQTSNLVYTITSLPQFGVVKTSAGATIGSVPFQLKSSQFTFEPSGSSGTAQILYTVKDVSTGLTSLQAGLVQAIVTFGDSCVLCDTLTTTVVGSGEVHVQRKFCSSGQTCDFDFGTGSVLKLEARPVGAGSVFDHWSGDCSGTNPITTVTLNGDKSCTAHFIFQIIFNP